MRTIKIIKDSIAKARLAQAIELGPNEKFQLKAGAEITVSAIAPQPTQGYIFVTLGKAADGSQIAWHERNSWYVYQADTDYAVIPTKAGVEAIALIKEFEGCELEAYTCPAGVLTIGVGHTGDDVQPDQKITQQQADSLLQKDLGRFEKGVLSAVKVHLNQNELDALIAFSFNCGLGALKESTLLKKLNAGDRAGAANEFLKWDKADGRSLPGLTRRRKAERALFLGEDWRAAAK